LVSEIAGSWAESKWALNMEEMDVVPVLAAPIQ